MALVDSDEINRKGRHCPVETTPMSILSKPHRTAHAETHAGLFACIVDAQNENPVGKRRYSAR